MSRNTSSNPDDSARNMSPLNPSDKARLFTIMESGNVDDLNGVLGNRHGSDIDDITNRVGLSLLHVAATSGNVWCLRELITPTGKKNETKHSYDLYIL
uniref:Ankyrin repeat protein n=1 Tax=viral metagenome TaxID=1070528 RepID=A0A6C0D3B3_9ZZZZ